MACSGGGSLGKRKSPPPPPFSFGQRVAFAVTLWTTDCDHNECSNWDVAKSQVIEVFPSFPPYFVWEQKYRGRRNKRNGASSSFLTITRVDREMSYFRSQSLLQIFFWTWLRQIPSLELLYFSRVRDIAASCFEIPFFLSTEKKHLLLLLWRYRLERREKKLPWVATACREGRGKKISPFRWPRSWNGFSCSSLFIAFSIWAGKCLIFLNKNEMEMPQVQVVYFFLLQILSLPIVRKKVSSTDNGEGRRRSLIRASPPSIDGTGGEHHRPIVSSHKPPKRKRERKIKEEQKGKPPACPNLGEKESTLRKFFLRLLLIAAYPPILGFSAFSEWTDGEIVFPSALLPSLIFRISGLCFAKKPSFVY